MGKFLHIYILLAILNPLCCCDVAASLTSTEPTDEAMVHGCCSKETPPNQSEKHHDRSDCPHQSGNGYLQAAVDHIKAPGFTTDFIFGPVLGVLDTSEVGFAQDGNTSSVQWQTTLNGKPPEHRYRLFCAYLI